MKGGGTKPGRAGAAPLGTASLGEQREAAEKQAGAQREAQGCWKAEHLPER